MKSTNRILPFLIASLAMAALYVSTGSPALADGCQAIKSAIAARERSSYSTVTTNSDITVRNVYTATRVYSQVQGIWSSDPRPPLKQRLQAVEQMEFKGACRPTKTEMIGGQAADVYTDGGSTVWISKSTNLLLKMSSNLGLGRTIETFSYGNVQVPPGVR